MREIRVGIIGLDSSHAVEFTKILNDVNHPYHVDGAKVVAAIPFVAYDLPLSYERVDVFTEQVQSFKQIKIMDTLHGVVQAADAILLTSVDGRNRVRLFRELAPYKKPIFIDKPLALSLQETQEIFSLSEKYNTPIMSSSALRYAEKLTSAILDHKDINGLYVYGPLPLQDAMPGYFWYGIHMVEVLVTVMGGNFKHIHVENNVGYEVVTIEFNDGRIATIRGDLTHYQEFGAIIHRNDQAIPVEISKGKPFYASLLERVVPFFQTGKSPISAEEMMSVIRVMEEIHLKRNFK